MKNIAILLTLLLASSCISHSDSGLENGLSEIGNETQYLEDTEDSKWNENSFYNDPQQSNSIPENTISIKKRSSPIDPESLPIKEESGIIFHQYDSDNNDEDFDEDFNEDDDRKFEKESKNLKFLQPFKRNVVNNNLEKNMLVRKNRNENSEAQKIAQKIVKPKLNANFEPEKERLRGLNHQLEDMQIRLKKVEARDLAIREKKLKEVKGFDDVHKQAFEIIHKEIFGIMSDAEEIKRNVENITSSKNRIEEILKTPWIPKSLNGGHISGKGITKKVFFL